MLIRNTEFIETLKCHVTLYRKFYGNKILSLYVCMYWLTQHSN
jgi:hypothetical protein